MVSKFTEKQLAQWEAEAELLVYKTFQTQNAQLGLPHLSSEQERQFLLGNERCSPKIWEFFAAAGPTAKQRLFTQAVFTAILSENEINRYELVCNNLSEFFTGSQADSSQSEKMAYKNFNYYKELSVEAMKFFHDHFARSDYFGFSSSAYQQWFASLRLGLYSGPERVLNGAGSLNYPDLRTRTDDFNSEISDRLQALKSYLEVIYQLRVKVQLLDLLIRNRQHVGTSPNISMGQWEKFLNTTRSRLNSKFGNNKGAHLFRQMFGSDNPNAPTSQGDFNQIQNEILNKFCQAILAEQLGQDWAPREPADGFHRDYAKEQRAREEREQQNKERKKKENLNWADIDPTFSNNPNLVKQWTEKGFNWAQVKDWINIGLKSSDSEFVQFLQNIKNLTPEQVLNYGDLEKLKEEFHDWKKQPQPKPEAPKPEQKEPKPRDKSPSRQAAEDKINNNTENIPPPVETSFNSSSLNETLNKLKGSLEKDRKNHGHDTPFTPSPGLGMPLNSIMKEDAQKLPWLVMGFNLHSSGSFPKWEIANPIWFKGLRQGEGDLVDLLLRLIEVEKDSMLLHNFFKIKHFDKKGFELFDKPEPLEERERERERERAIINNW